MWWSPGLSCERVREQTVDVNHAICSFALLSEAVRNRPAEYCPGVRHGEEQHQYRVGAWSCAGCCNRRCIAPHRCWNRGGVAIGVAIGSTTGIRSRFSLTDAASNADSRRGRTPQLTSRRVAASLEDTDELSGLPSRAPSPSRNRRVGGCVPRSEVTNAYQGFKKAR